MSHQAQCQKVIHYLDDFLLIEQPGVLPGDLDRLTVIFGNFNISIAEHKVEGPAHSITFLRVNLDTRSMQASLPLDKLTRIRSVLQDFTRTQRVY